MNLAVRRRLANLRTVLFFGGQIHRQGSGRCRKIGMRSGKCQNCMVCFLKMQNSTKNTKKALQNARLMELITRFELVTSSLPSETNYLNI